MFPLCCPRLCWSASLQVGFAIYGFSHLAAAFLLDLSPMEQPVENNSIKSHSGVTLACISKSILRWLQIWPTLKPVLSKQQLHLEAKIWKEKLLKSSFLVRCFCPARLRAAQLCSLLLSAPWFSWHVFPQPRLQPWLSQQRTGEAVPVHHCIFYKGSKGEK